MSVPDCERKERAVSELIGAILLVSLVAIAMAIVAVVLLSNPPPEEVPQLNVLAGNSSDSIYLLHTGGDELKEEQTLIRINNNPDPVPHSAIYLKSEDGTTESSSWDVTRTPWTVGKTLMISSEVPPQGVSVVYQGPTSQNLILTTSFIASSGGSVPTTTGATVTATTTITTITTATTTTTITTTTSPTPTPTPTCGTISGYKWNDANGNGIRDTGEPGLSGWTIKASECIQGNCNTLGTPVSTVTNASGYYLFSGLTYQPATWYRLQETLQAGWSATSPSGGYKDIKLEPPGSGGQPAKCYESNINFGNRPVQPPAANFQAIPTSGAAPLQVQFTDTSTGNPTQWLWDINNDGIVDYTVQNPVHTYTSVGTYTVRLSVTGPGGSNTLIKTNYISVSAPQAINVYLNADKGSAIQSGGYIQFRVTGLYSYIRHGGSYYSLNTGDIVKMEITNDGTGNIYATSNTINEFRFDNVKLSINGNDKGTKDIGSGDLWISSYDSYLSTLTIVVPAQSAWTQLMVNGIWIINGNDGKEIRVMNLQPGTFGIMNLNTRTDVFYNGGATGYQVN